VAHQFGGGWGENQNRMMSPSASEPVTPRIEGVGEKEGWTRFPSYSTAARLSKADLD